MVASLFGFLGFFGFLGVDGWWGGVVSLGGMSADVEARVDEIIMDITAEALVKVREVRDAEDDPESLGLRIEITGSQGVDYTYDLAFESLGEVEDGDRLYSVGGDGGAVPVMIAGNSVENLRGATLDLPSNPMQGGLVIRNPNRPNPLEGKSIELEGSVAERLEQLLDKQINPSLAGHGGWCKVTGVEVPKAFVVMGGGCQGCAMSAATLREGITVMITQMIPEITEVVDTTDHESGETPYFN